jgi:tRNA (5-methylaminomethyl-2-thiouridylate)-methyltransferase
MSLREIIARAVASLPPPSRLTGRVAHLALSGGVDSSVAGFLLRERGWDVRPVLMRCWADADDAETGTSCFTKELRAAELAVKALKLERRLSVFDFVAEYWTNVFQDVLLAGLEAGDTPNQDLACNAFIKFGSFPRRLADESSCVESPPFATGHYARIDHGLPEGRVRLLRAVDPVKDQTYFLATVPSDALRHAMFPVGGLLKKDVREIAAHVGLPAAQQKSSRGICFVGKRNKAAFIERYMVEHRRSEKGGQGSFVRVDTTERIAPLAMPAYAYTIGQRARIGGQPQAFYVVGRLGNNILVSSSKLLVADAICEKPVWLSGSAPAELEGRRSSMRLQFKSCSSAAPNWCTVAHHCDGRLQVSFEVPEEARAAGQALVFYNGEEVLGSAIISRHN